MSPWSLDHGSIAEAVQDRRAWLLVPPLRSAELIYATSREEARAFACEVHDVTELPEGWTLDRVGVLP